MVDAKRLLDQFLGGQPGGAADGKKGEDLDLSRVGDLARDFGGKLSSSGLGGIGGGALAGGLASILLGSKQGRKLAGSAVKLGGLAVIGALAYTAYKNWQAGKESGAGETRPAAGVLTLPPPADTPFSPSSESEQQRVSRNLLRAMIAAAKADGHIDADEQARIFAQMDKFDLDAEGKAFVMDELREPLDIDSVVSAARTPEEAAEIYAASLLANDVANAAERSYLALLASRLGLDDKLVEHVHASVQSATTAVDAP